MSQQLSLSNNRPIDVGLSFVCPEDDIIAMTAGPEVQAALAESLQTREVTNDTVDRETGMKVMPLAKITVTTRAGVPESVLFMNKQELIRHAYACRAIIKSMDRAAELADGEWREYREEIRRRG